MVMWGKIWFLLLAVTLRHFIRLRWGFHYTYSFCVAKMSVMFWTLLCKFLILLLKIGVTYNVTLSRKVKNTFYNGKNLKKIFLQLRCFNVLLHMEYKYCSVSQKLNLRSCRRKSPSIRPSWSTFFAEIMSKKFVFLYCG